MTQAIAKPVADVLRYLTPKGLALPQALPFSEWAGFGGFIGRLVRALPWVVADWIIYGEDHYGERYSQAIEATGLQAETVSNYVSVGRVFPPSRRRDSALVPFSLHADLAALPKDEQTAWLDKAETEGWTRSQLREALGKGRKVLEEPHPPHSCKRCGMTWDGGPEPNANR